MKKVVEICGERCPNESGGPDYVCQRPKHKLYPAAKHWDNRDGLVMWTQAGADRVAAEQRAAWSLRSQGRQNMNGAQ